MTTLETSEGRTAKCVCVGGVECFRNECYRSLERK